MRANLLSVIISAIMLSLGASFAAAQYVAPPAIAPAVVVPYDAPSAVVIPRAGSIGRATTPPTYYRSAPQMVPTNVYRPVTSYHPVTGQPYTTWQGASTLDVETQRVATPLPGYGAPFAAYRPAAPVAQMPAYYAPAPQMNVQGSMINAYTGNMIPSPAYSTYRPAYSVAPAYAVGRPAMGAPVVSNSGAWPWTLRNPAPVVVQQRPTVPIYTPAPAYSGAPYPTNFVGPSYAAPAYSAPTSASPVYTQPNYGQPSYGGPIYSGQGTPAVINSPSYGDPPSSSPTYSDPYYTPSSSAPSGAPADYQPSLRSSGMSTAPPKSSPLARSASEVPSTSNQSAIRPLVPAQEARSTTTKPQVNWPSFLPSLSRQPAPATGSNTPTKPESPEPTAGRVTEKKPAAEYDPEVRPLRDPSARMPNLNDHRAPPLLDQRSAGISAPIRRLTLTPKDNVTGHTTNPSPR